jgi:hypothetical protein
MKKPEQVILVTKNTISLPQILSILESKRSLKLDRYSLISGSKIIK